MNRGKVEEIDDRGNALFYFILAIPSLLHSFVLFSISFHPFYTPSFFPIISGNVQYRQSEGQMFVPFGTQYKNYESINQSINHSCAMQTMSELQGIFCDGISIVCVYRHIFQQSHKENEIFKDTNEDC